METATKKTKYRWENRLSYKDRTHIGLYYLEGYGLDRIGKTFGVTASTVEYHLKLQDLFVPYRRPTLFGPIDKKKITVPVARKLVARDVDNEKYYYDEYGERYERPKSYAQIFRKQMNIQAYKIRMTPRVDPQPESKRFLLKVNLSSGTIIAQDCNGHYEITQRTQPTLVVSTAIYSM